MDDTAAHAQPGGVASPCITICQIDLASGWCIGCGRTGDEIAEWLGATDARRLAILDTLPARMATLRT